MQRLALRKYDEIVALDTLPSGQSKGDFDDLGETRFTWQADRTSLGIGDLDSIRVRVFRKGGDQENPAEIQGLLCRSGGNP